MIFFNRVCSRRRFRKFSTQNRRFLLFVLITASGSPALVHAELDNRQRLLMSSQWNETRQHTQFNPGIFAVEQRHHQIALDNDLKLAVHPNVSAATRFAWIGEQTNFTANADANSSERDHSAVLLEAELSWHSRFRTRQLRIGRIKPQWSQGFNWPVLDLLRPDRSRPNFDQDNLRQQQGFDMINVRWRQSSWGLSALVATMDDNQYAAQHQSALRLSHEGSVDSSLIWHYLPGVGHQWGASLSILISDASSLRVESSYERQRDRPDFDAQGSPVLASDGYLKTLIGYQYSLEQWDIRAEYLYNQHAYNNSEQQQLNQLSDTFAQRLTSAEAALSYAFFASVNQAMAQGQSSRHGLYLMYTNQRDQGFWSWQQSVQLNTNDGSQYHQLQLGQRWSDEWHSRVQLEYFTGNKQSEFGRLPSQFNARASLYWSF